MTLQCHQDLSLNLSCRRGLPPHENSLKRYFRRNVGESDLWAIAELAYLLVLRACDHEIVPGKA